MPGEARYGACGKQWDGHRCYGDDRTLRQLGEDIDRKPSFFERSTRP